uniref:Uncharacterized protein n=1 Tax=Rhizophora mucronata TaxID=61149 RepID=A0A2P2QEI3_RHIMU
MLSTEQANSPRYHNPTPI